MRRILLLLLAVLASLSIAQAIEYTPSEALVLSVHDSANSSACYFDVWYPNGTKWLNNITSAYIGGNNSINSSYALPEIYGAYSWQAVCNGTFVQLDSFHVVRDVLANGGVAIGLGLLVLAFVVISINIDIPYIDGLFLMLAQFISIIALRVFNTMSGRMEYLVGYRIMIYVTIFTAFIMFVFLLIDIVTSFKNKKGD